MNRPELTLTFGEKVIRWTYGLQMDLNRLVPDAESVINSVLNEPFIRDYLVRRTLTDLKKSVTDEKELLKAEDVDLDPDQISDLIDWVSGHLLYFFAKSQSRLMVQAKDYQASLPLVPSKTGSEN